MMRSSAYKRLGVLRGTSWRASGPRWPSFRGDGWPMITLFPSQGDFYATALFTTTAMSLCAERVAAWRNSSRKLVNAPASAVYRSILSHVLDALYVRGDQRSSS